MRLVYAAGVAGLLVGGFAAWAGAEEPQAKKDEPQLKKYTTLAGKASESPLWRSKKNFITENGEAPDEESAKIFDTHYKYAIAELTRPDNDARHAERRQQLKKELQTLGTKPKTTLHDSLLKMLEMMLPKVFNNEDCFPAARYNCLLLYGDLNSKEGELNGRGAVPLSTTLPTLMQVFKNADGKYPVILQLAALVGVTRHVEASAPAEVRRDVVQTLVGWLRNPPSKGLSPDVQNFVRRRAADVLRILIVKGPEANTPEVTAALQQFAADEDVPLDDRCETVRTLGMLDAKTFGEKNVPVVARTIALLAAEVGRQAATADALLEDEAEPDADAAADAKADEPAEAAAAEKPAAKSQLALPPEWQTYFLASLRYGLDGPESVRGRGLSNAATGDSKQLVGELSKKITAMIDVVKRKKKDDRLSDAELQKMDALAADLEAMIGNPKPGTADSAAEQARVPRGP